VPHESRISSPSSTELRRSQGGVGLGLPIAKSIVEAHGGTLALATHVTPGACFVIELPLEQQPEVPPEDDRMSKGKVLVIDDEQSIRRLLRISLEAREFDVVDAASGTEGLAMAPPIRRNWSSSI